MTTIIDRLVLELGFDTSKLPADQQKAVYSLNTLEERAGKVGGTVAATGQSVSGVFRQLEHPVAALRLHLERLVDYTYRPQVALHAGERTGSEVDANALTGVAGLRALSVAGLGAFAMFKTVNSFMSDAAERTQHVFNVGVGTKSAGAPIGDFSAITQAFLKHGNVPEAITGSWLSMWTQAQQDLFVNKSPDAIQALNEALQRAGIYDVDVFDDKPEQAIEKISADLHKMSPEAATAAGRALGMDPVLAQAAQNNGVSLPGYIADARQTALNNSDLKASTARLDSYNNMLTNLNRLLTTIDDELTPAIVGLNNFLAKIFYDPDPKNHTWEMGDPPEPGSFFDKVSNWWNGKGWKASPSAPAEGLQSSYQVPGASGGPASSDDPRGMIPVLRAAAIANGLNPDDVVALARQEGLGIKGYGNPDSGSISYGVMQMHVGGLADVYQKATGRNPADPANEVDMIQWAIHYGAQHGFRKDWSSVRHGLAPEPRHLAPTDTSSANRGLPVMSRGYVFGKGKGGDVDPEHGHYWVDPKQAAANTIIAKWNAQTAATTNSSKNNHHNTDMGNVHVHVNTDANPYQIGGAISASLHDSLRSPQASNGLTP